MFLRYHMHISLAGSDLQSQTSMLSVSKQSIHMEYLYKIPLKFGSERVNVKYLLDAYKIVVDDNVRTRNGYAPRPTNNGYIPIMKWIQSLLKIIKMLIYVALLKITYSFQLESVLP